MPEAVASHADPPLNRQCSGGAPTPLLVSPLEGGRDESSLGRHRCAGEDVGVRGSWCVLPFRIPVPPPSRGEVRRGVGSPERARSCRVERRDRSLNRQRSRVAPTPLPVSLPPGSRPSHNPRIRRCRPIAPIWSGCPPHNEIQRNSGLCEGLLEGGRDELGVAEVRGVGAPSAPEAVVSNADRPLNHQCSRVAPTPLLGPVHTTC